MQQGRSHKKGTDRGNVALSVRGEMEVALIYLLVGGESGSESRILRSDGLDNPGTRVEKGQVRKLGG